MSLEAMDSNSSLMEVNSWDGTLGGQPMNTSTKNMASRRSKVWEFFTREKGNDWSCNLCSGQNPPKKFLVSSNKDSSTTDFWRHLRDYHPNTIQRPKYSNTSKKISIKKRPPMQMLRSPSVSTSNPLVRGIQREKTTEEELARLIYTCDLPWSIADNENFVRWSNYCAQSQMNVPSSENCRKALKEMRERQKREVRKEFTTVSRFSVTVGFWAVCEMNVDDEYIFHITIHWIDGKWKLREKVLGLLYSPDRDIDKTCTQVWDVLEDYNLMNKVRLN